MWRTRSGFAAAAALAMAGNGHAGLSRPQPDCFEGWHPVSPTTTTRLTPRCALGSARSLPSMVRAVSNGTSASQTSTAKPCGLPRLLMASTCRPASSVGHGCPLVTITRAKGTAACAGDSTSSTYAASGGEAGAVVGGAVVAGGATVAHPVAIVPASAAKAHRHLTVDASMLEHIPA